MKDRQGAGRIGEKDLTAPGRPEDPEVLRRIAEAIQSVRYGQVQIIIQDSRVVQIDTTEKVRLV